ncbi:somatostatin receptor type 1-like [Lytechinus variegatus]|uniref:somatostatin receptor type 1-like n=1 Tax=Lytechinus variegatus TaxID=7654 RepID=UPI001BB279D3|nr:somatostatin receptor type 1-like [Lytechinus variegatus]
MNNTSFPAEIEWGWAPFTWEWWVVTQLAFSLMGIVGNILVIIVVIRRGKTRFATDILIGNLAFADFFTSLWMIPRPQSDSIPDNWKGMLYCRIEYSNVFMWISTVASVFILTVISVERLVAVKYPLKFKLIFSVQRSLWLVVFSWIGAAVLNTYTLAISKYDSENHTCKTELIGNGAHLATGTLLFLFKYMIPIAVMIGSHLAIIRELRADARSFEADGRNSFENPTHHISQTIRKMTHTVLIVVIVFIVCWSPDQICFFLFNLNVYPAYMYSDIYRVFVCLGFVNSCSNPFIYSVRNDKFRKELSIVLCISKHGAKESNLYFKTISGQINE